MRKLELPRWYPGTISPLLFDLSEYPRFDQCPPEGGATVTQDHTYQKYDRVIPTHLPIINPLALVEDMCRL